MKRKRLLGFLLSVLILLTCFAVPAEKAYSADVPFPSNLRWENAYVAAWDRVPGANSYVVKLYRMTYNTSVPIKNLEITQTSRDFYLDIATTGSGYYYFTIQARVKTLDGTLQSDVSVSAAIAFFMVGEEEVTVLNASITAPMGGRTPDLSPMSGDPDKYDVEVHMNSSGQYYWFKTAYAGSFLLPTEKYVIGNKYSVLVEFVPQNGYTLQPVSSMVKLNGRTGTLRATDNDRRSVMYSFDFTARDPVEAFVERLYYVCLDRAPDTSGFNDWVTRLKNKTSTGIQVAKGFIFSNEFKNKSYCNECYVKHLYRAFMGREFDQAGLVNWTNKIKSGWKRQQIFNGFANSPEFKNICATYGITQGTKIQIPALETVVPFEYCKECRAPGLTKYTITYKVNGGTMPSSGVKNWYTVESATYTLPKPARSGYTFQGWYRDTGFTQKVTSIPNGSTGNKTFYARWKKN